MALQWRLGAYFSVRPCCVAIDPTPKNWTIDVGLVKCVKQILCFCELLSRKRTSFWRLCKESVTPVFICVRLGEDSDVINTNMLHNNGRPITQNVSIRDNQGKVRTTNVIGGKILP